MVLMLMSGLSHSIFSWLPFDALVNISANETCVQILITSISFLLYLYDICTLFDIKFRIQPVPVATHFCLLLIQATALPEYMNTHPLVDLAVSQHLA